MDKKDVKSELSPFLPQSINKIFESIGNLKWDKLTEIRVTLGCPLIVSLSNKRYYVTNKGISTTDKDSYIVTKDDVKIITELITRSSIYSYERFINAGYITLTGGNRVGITGTCNCIDKNVMSVQNISSFNIRIAHENIGASDIIIDEIYSNSEISSTLIISAPGCGKTTMLRDIARSLSNYERFSKLIVCAIVDERFEIAYTCEGRATLDVGKNNFVISGCVKSTAIPMIVRTMAPDVIITDEICNEDDYKAVSYARLSGCAVIASVHGNSETQNELINFDYKNVFDKIIILSSRKGPGTVEKIIRSENTCYI